MGPILASTAAVELSYNSCSHGAGRIMSRNQAKRSLTVESLEEAMVGKAWTGNGTGLLDEHPRPTSQSRR